MIADLAEPAVNNQHEAIIMALIAIVATSIGALVYAIKNNSLSVQINRAVNNVGPGDHHLIDLIKQIKDKQDIFDKAWGNLPDDMDDAVGLVEVLHGIKNEVALIQTQLVEHVEWEMSVKWADDATRQIPPPSSQ